MIVALHIVAATLGLVLSAAVSIKPVARLIMAVYGCLAVTVGSGTFLVISTRTHILSVCLSGLFYVGAVTLSLGFAKRRLARQTAP